MRICAIALDASDPFAADGHLRGRELSPTRARKQRGHGEFGAQIDAPAHVRGHVGHRGDLAEADDLAHVEHRQSLGLRSQGGGEITCGLGLSHDRRRLAHVRSSGSPRRARRRAWGWHVRPRQHGASCRLCG